MINIDVPLSKAPVNKSFLYALNRLVIKPTTGNDNIYSIAPAKNTIPTTEAESWYSLYANGARQGSRKPTREVG